MQYELYTWVDSYKTSHYFILDTIQKSTTPSAGGIPYLFINKKVIKLMEYVNQLEEPLLCPILLCSFNNYDDLMHNNPELFI